jgi:hypothetical protein
MAHGRTFLRSMRLDRKPEAVRWYGSSGLFRQLRRIARLSWEGDVIDARDWMQPNVLVYAKGELSSQLDWTRWKEGEPDSLEDGAIWFDYVADTGDDWYATHDIAFLLQGDLWVEPGQGLTPGVSVNTLRQGTPDLPRGNLLIFGGDTAYYVASAHAIRQRLVDAFDTAYEERFQGRSQPPPRPLLGIPGNHDWYDSLDGFGRLFRVRVSLASAGGYQRRPHRQGPIVLQGHFPVQDASYFALRLPWQWDLWGVDIQKAKGHIDARQIGFFTTIDRRRAESQLEPGPRKLILLNSIPVVESGLRDPVGEGELDRIVESADTTLPKYQLRLDLAGDTHNYQRYDLGAETVAPGGKRMAVVAGGGGAFLHPTHHLPGPLPVQKTYPTPADSRRLSSKLLNPLTMYRAGMVAYLIVILQVVLLWRLVAPQQASSLIYLSPLVALYGISIGADFPPRRRGWSVAIGAGLGLTVAPGLAYLILGTPYLLPALILTALLFVSLMVFGVFAGGLRDVQRGRKFWAWGLILAFAGTEASLPYLPTLVAGIGQSMAGITVAVAWSLVISVLAPFLFGAYLWASLNQIGGHRNEAFSALHYPGYKHFIRFKLEPDQLTGYVIGFDHPSTGSDPMPKGRLIDLFVLSTPASDARQS